MAEVADRGEGAVAGAQVVLRLHDRHDAETGHARDLLVGGQPAVLDAVAHVGARDVRLCLVDGVEHHADGERRLCVGRRLQSGGVGAVHELRVLLGRVVELPVVAAVGRVALREVGRPAAEGAVRVELHALHAEQVVAETVDDAEVEGHVEQGGGEVRRDAHPQRAARTGPQVGLHLAT